MIILSNLAPVFSVLPILRLEDDAWLQHLHRMPCTSRHHTAEVAKAWVKMDASCFVAIVIVCYFDKFAAENDDCLIAMGMAMYGNDSSWQQSIQYALTIVISIA